MARCPACQEEFDGAAFCPKDGAKLVAGAASSNDRSGQVIEGRYRLLRLVGRGGMGEVYEAEHVHIDKRVALKLLHPHLVADAQAVERLHREARSTSSIGHPNIVHIEDFGHSDDGSVYLAMEWLEGETLQSRLERAPLPIPDVLATMSDVAAGVAASHASGVVHRDLKPANIFLSRAADGTEAVKVLDFGIAKLVSVDSNLTMTGAFIGTPHYMAPEQGQSQRVDARSDVYSMGVVLYELICGTVPFGGDSPIAVLQQHAHRLPEPPRKRAPERGISSELEAVVLKTLAKKPADRYANALAFKSALDALLPAAASEPPPTSARAPEPEAAPVDLADDSLGFDIPGGKRRIAPLLLAGLLVVGLTGGAIYMFLRGGDEGTPVERFDAAATAASPPSDAAPPTPEPPDAAAAPSPPDAAAPAPIEGWTYRSKTAGTSFEVSTSPRVLSAKEPFDLELAIVSPSPALARALETGDTEIVFHYLYYKGHSKSVGSALALSSDGTMPDPENVRLKKTGKYHVRALVKRGDDTVWTGRFDICVGADPDGPKVELKEICPGLNRKR